MRSFGAADVRNWRTALALLALGAAACPSRQGPDTAAPRNDAATADPTGDPDEPRGSPGEPVVSRPVPAEAGAAIDTAEPTSATDATSDPGAAPGTTDAPAGADPETGDAVPAARPRTAGEPIGSATMRDDGTIELVLRAEGPGGLVGDALLVYPVGHRQYREILEHLGGLAPGETKPVPPWPDE
jgi:hypothetical protein